MTLAVLESDPLQGEIRPGALNLLFHLKTTINSVLLPSAAAIIPPQFLMSAVVDDLSSVRSH